MTRAARFQQLALLGIVSALGSAQLLAQIPFATKILIPAFPPVAASAKQEGAITFHLSINPSGQVDSIVVGESCTKVSAILEPLKAALLQWRFSPGSPRSLPIIIKLNLIPFEASVIEETCEISCTGEVLLRKREIRLENVAGY